MMKTTPNNPKEKQRLSKVMAKAGIASRRQCEELIFAGRVKVNGETALLPQTMVGPSDKITFDGTPVAGSEELVYFVLNKPTGYVCSNKPGFNRNILDLFSRLNMRLFTIGRLDKNTSGLLLVTNDGHFANKVIHPSANIYKEYIATVDKPVNRNHLQIIMGGTIVEEIFVKPDRVDKIAPNRLKIIVSEGKKREVRILIENAKLQVVALERTRIGNLTLDPTLNQGEWRPMTEEEKQLIFEKDISS